MKDILSALQLASAVRIAVKRRLGLFPPRAEYFQADATVTFSQIEKLELGRYIHIGPRSFISATGGLSIGDGTIISANVTILTSNHDYKSGDFLPYGANDVLRPVHIGTAVWIGFGAIILPGATVGDGAIVAAGAVVTGDVPAGAIFAGNPASEVGKRVGDSWKRLLAEQRFYLAWKEGQLT
jgi:maltose O-acetyltransferase